MCTAIAIVVLILMVIITWRRYAVVGGEADTVQEAQPAADTRGALVQADLSNRNHKQMERAAVGFVRSRMKTLPYYESSYPALSTGSDVIDAEFVD
jgi:hypothetical protein